VIEALYSGAKETELTMNITFEDGRRSSLTTTLAVHEVFSRDAVGCVAA
jgi:long-chain acyl-CoA synthetase